MSQATFVIIDTTGEESVWEETSPKDPTTVTVSPYGHQEIRSSADQGPWTVSLKSHAGKPARGGVIFDENAAGTQACICLSDGSAGIFNVQIPRGNSPQQAHKAKKGHKKEHKPKKGQKKGQKPEKR